MTHVCMALLTAVWFLTGCQIPTQSPSSLSASTTVLEEPRTDVLMFIAVYRCYRLTGRFDEAHEARERIANVVERSGSAINLWQRLSILVALRVPRTVIDADYITVARRAKEACREAFGIYELTLRHNTTAPPLGAVLSLPRSK